MSDQLVQTGELDKSAIARWARRAWNAEAEIDRLRALNAELREALEGHVEINKRLMHRCGFDEQAIGDSTAQARAILAKSQEAAS